MVLIGIVALFLASNREVARNSLASFGRQTDSVLWQIGLPKLSTSQFGLGPNGYAQYRGDSLFVIGQSGPKDLPYVLPGPNDQWAGSKPHEVEIVFGLKTQKLTGSGVLDLKFADSQASIPPRLEIYVNQHLVGTFQSPNGGGDASINGDLSHAVPSEIRIQIPGQDLQAGNNRVEIENNQGSWILFRSLSFETAQPWILGKVKSEIQMNSMPQAQVVYRTKNGPMQPCEWAIENIGPNRIGNFKISENQKLVKKGVVKLSPGRQVISMDFPRITKPERVEVKLKFGTKSARSFEEVEPIRHWIIDLMPHAHLDVGYTNTQKQVSSIHRQNLLYALQVHKLARTNPPDSQYHYNFEGTWILNQVVRHDSKSDIQKIKRGLDDGILYCSAAYANELTGLMRGEEMMASYRLGQILGSKLGVHLTVATQTDVPGVTWGDTVALHAAGVKALLLMPNPADRLGDVIRDWQDKPFWWQTPDGRHKVLLWETVTYGMAHGIRPWNGIRNKIFRTANPDKDFIGRYVFPRLATLAAQNYPYRLIAIPWSDTDNSPVDGDVPQAAKDWNQKYLIPEVRLKTFQSAAEDMIKMYGAELPIRRGDLSPYWEDGAGSSARETSMNRWSADRLVQAETLDAMRSQSTYNRAAFMRAWSNVVLYSEHTWGSYDSISNPMDPFTLQVWKRKKQFATDAKRESLELLDKGLGIEPALVPFGENFKVWNTHSWNQSGIVELSRDQSLVGDRAETWPGKIPLETQRLPSHKLAIEVPNVPPFGAIEIRIVPGNSVSDQHASAFGSTLENRWTQVKIDPQTGAISHFIDRKTGHDYVMPGSLGLNRYQYLIGGSLKDVQFAAAPHITMVENGPLVFTLEVSSSAPGTQGLTVDYTLNAFSPELQITDILEKLPVLKKGSVHIAFPFAVKSGIIRDDLPWSIIRPETDQLPGANRNWLTTDRFADVSNANRGISLISEDAPLIEIGGITANIMGGGYQSKDWIKHLVPTQTIDSWALNNIWYTNYLAEQSGKLVFRYQLFPHEKYVESVSREMGTDATEPLLVSAGGSGPESSLCQIIGHGVIATSLKPCDDHRGFILRLWGASAVNQEVGIKWKNGAKISVWLSDLAEESLSRIDPRRVLVPSHGEVTLRIELAK